MNFLGSLHLNSVIPIGSIAYKCASLVLIVRLNCIHFIFETVNLTENIEFTFYLLFIEKWITKLVETSIRSDGRFKKPRIGLRIVVTLKTYFMRK